MKQMSFLLLAQAASLASCADTLASNLPDPDGGILSELVPRAESNSNGQTGKTGQTGQGGKCWNLKPWEDLYVPWDEGWDGNDLGFADVKEANEEALDDGAILDARNLDWSDIDREDGVNLTRILQSRDLEHLDIDNAHRHIESLVSRALANDEPDEETDGDGTEEGLLHVLQARTNRLESRAPAKFSKQDDYKICNYGGRDEAHQMVYWCPKYVHARLIYDTYDPEDWQSAEHLEIKRKDLKQRQVAKSTWDKGARENRRYISEHNLEKQALQHFFREEIEMKRKKTATGTVDALAESFSELFEFKDETDANGKTKSVPDRRSAPSGFEKHFDNYCHFIQYFWSGYNVEGIDPKSPDRPLNKVGFAWPNGPEEDKKAGGIKVATKGATEMVSIQQQLNGVKAKLFGLKQMISKTEMNKKLNDVTQKPDDLIRNIQDYLNRWRLALLVISYMNHADIKHSYKTQADRVGKALTTAEQEVVDFWDDSKWDSVKQAKMDAAAKAGQIDDAVPKYETQDLSLKWTEYIKRFHGDVSERAYKWLEDQQSELKKQFDSLNKEKKKAEDDANKEKDATKKKPLKDRSDKLASLHKVMDTIQKEVEKKITGSKLDKRSLISNPW